MHRARREARPGAPVEEIRLVDVAGVFFDHWKILLAVPLVAGAVVLGLTKFATPMYTAGTRILVPQQTSGAAAMVTQQLGALAGLAGAVGVKNPADQFVSLINSRTVANRLVERFALAHRYGASALVDARRVLAKRTEVASGKDGLISIDVEDADPRMAAQLAAGYVDELTRLVRELAIGEAAQRREFFERQLATTRERLDAASAALRAGGVSEGVLKSEPRVAIEAVARIKAAITTAEVRLAGMRHAMSDTNPDYRQALQELGGLRAQLAKAEAADTKSGPGADDYVARFRDFKYQETLFELLARQLEMARLDEAREGGLVQVVDAAEVPERRSWPRRTMLSVLAAVGAFVATVFVVFLAEGTSGRFADPVSAQRLAGLRRRLLPRRRTPASGPTGTPR